MQADMNLSDRTDIKFTLKSAKPFNIYSKLQRLFHKRFTNSSDNEKQLHRHRYSPAYRNIQF